MKNRKGFTLLEILLVVAALAILAGIVILAINPTKQLGETRNAQRNSDVNALLNAVYQYSIDNNGDFPAAIDTAGACTDAANLICSINTGTTAAAIAADQAACTTANRIYLNELVPDYLTALPEDPQVTAAANPSDVGYGVIKSGSRITVCAPGAEQSATIAVTR